MRERLEIVARIALGLSVGDVVWASRDVVWTSRDDGGRWPCRSGPHQRRRGPRMGTHWDEQVDDWLRTRGQSREGLQTPAARHAARTIEVMRRRWGPAPAGVQCGQCVYLQPHVVDRTYYKCAQYGVSSSSATDWRLRWPGCGRFMPRGQVCRSVPPDAGGAADLVRQIEMTQRRVDDGWRRD